MCLLISYLPFLPLNRHVICFSATIAQGVVLEHGEHTYYGDSDLEDFDDEEGGVPEQSKSECKSDVSCFYFCIGMHIAVEKIRVTVTITSRVGHICLGNRKFPSGP